MFASISSILYIRRQRYISSPIPKEVKKVPTWYQKEIHILWGPKAFMICGLLFKEAKTSVWFSLAGTV